MPTTWIDTVVKQTRRLGSFPYPHQLAFALHNPVRRLVSDPVTVVDRIRLDGSQHLLEVGPGPGFFSVELARGLPQGHLELFDLQPEMLDKARAKLNRAGIRDVGFTAGEAGGGLPFPDNTFDVAFLAFFEGFLDPDRLSLRELRDLAEPHGFSLASAQGSRWSDVIHFVKD